MTNTLSMMSGLKDGETLAVWTTLPQGEGGLNGEASESGSDAVPATVDRAQSRLEKNRRKE
ncbi:MAG: hypothetical protein ABJL17_07660 [Parvibaculum sp.]|uniref:hypothetical protein n=1 Tax=Parvibaculum sp. TaxID=2024848 RepID=UPI003265D0C4